jgi:hypothetical protein
MNAFNAQGLRLIIVASEVGAVMEAKEKWKTKWNWVPPTLEC